MRKSVCKFRGERLRAARLFRGLTILELAESADVSKQAISQFENGKSEPKPGTLGKLVLCLQFPVDYFYDQTSNDLVFGDTYFRSLTNTSSKDRQKQIEHVKLLVGIFRGISEYIDFPRLNLYPVSEELGMGEDMDQLAKEVRSFWGLGDAPILNVIDLLERNGVIINTTQTGGKFIDAFSQLIQGETTTYAVVILGDDKESAFRRNFSVTHELGHLLLDDFYNLSDMNNSEYHEMENRMNCFAGAFLIPERPFRQDLERRRSSVLQTYLGLKKKYMVSAAALIVRAQRLGLITAGTYQNLMKQMAKNGYRICEPGDKETTMLRPRYLREAMKMIFEEDHVKSVDFLNGLSMKGITLSAPLVEKVLNLRAGYLAQNDEIPLAISLKTR